MIFFKIIYVKTNLRSEKKYYRIYHDD